MIGISIADGAFQLVCAEPIGRRRYLDEDTVKSLDDFGRRYGKLLASNETEGLLELGRDLYRFLDGDAGQLTALIDQAPRPIHFEVAAPTRRPDQPALALSRAPWELLANEQGFIAGDDRLGFSPVRRLGHREAFPPLDRYRLGLTFMAASPRGAVELDYEREEAAIMAAVGSTDLDLLVEESGNPEELTDRLAEVPAMQALHLSCHGHNAWPPDGGAARRPILIMEDGRVAYCRLHSADLLQPSTRLPRFIFLSACLTAAGGGDQRPTWRGDKRPGDGPPGVLAQSLAEALIDGGFPAVLGWDGSVADRAATAFAATLYDNLASRSGLADAVASARRWLLNAADEALRKDWHLARLWVGPDGGGALVAGVQRRNLIPNHGEKEFLVKARRQVPVASHDMFVGRRRELQAVLRTLREATHAGVLLHGMGRLGKSSLAARIANRRRDLKLAVVFEHYGALDIFEALDDALKENPDARELVRQGARRVRERPENFEDALVDLLCAPCMEAGKGGTPLLLLIDDLERILDLDPSGGPTRFEPAFAPIIGGGASRLRSDDNRQPPNPDQPLYVCA